MTKRIDFTFKIDGFCDSFNYYRSETPFNLSAMPIPTTVGITDLTYSDTTAEANKIYYVIFGSVKGTTEKLSGQIVIDTANVDLKLTFKAPSFADEIKPTEWVVVGTDHQFILESNNYYSVRLNSLANTTPNYFYHTIGKEISTSLGFIGETELKFDFYLYDISNYNALFMLSANEGADADRLQFMLEGSNWVLYSTRGTSAALTHAFSNNFIINTWYAAKFVFRNKTVEIYINNQLITTAVFSGNLTTITAAHRLLVGISRNASSRRTSRCKFRNISFKNVT